MKDLDYQRWVAEALLSVVPRALELVAEHGLPDGHALYVSFDPRHPGAEIDAALAEQHPELMTIVLENQFWDLVTDDEGFSVVLAFGGQRRPLYVPWSAVRAFADPPAEFAFDAAGQLARDLRRLVGEVDGSGDGSADEESTEQGESEEESEGSRRFSQSRSGPAESASPAGEVVPFARPAHRPSPDSSGAANEEEE